MLNLTQVLDVVNSEPELPETPEEMEAMHRVLDTIQNRDDLIKALQRTVRLTKKSITKRLTALYKR